MRVRYFFYILLVSAAIAIQWPLWFGKGGISRMHALEAELTSIRESNDRLDGSQGRSSLSICP